jgi:hypothetical protein
MKGDKELVSRISAMSDKYLAILGFEGVRPSIKLSGRVAAKWLGRCKPHSKTFDGETRRRAVVATTIEILRSVCSDERTLERVIAHEVVHHVQFLTQNRGGHGADFLDRAARINAVAGAGFVTVKCFEGDGYVLGPTHREFFVMVRFVAGQYQASWSPTVTDRVAAEIGFHVHKYGARVFTSTESWLTLATKLGASRTSFRASYFPALDRQEYLAKLYNEGRQVIGLDMARGKAA